MKKEIDIHNYPKKLEQTIRLVKETRISEENKKLILDFKDFSSLEGGMGLPRIVRYLGILKDWAKILEVDFDKATKDDLKRAVRVIQENERYSAWTKATYKIMLKRFYRWLKNTGKDHPDEVKWIDTSIKRTEKKLISNGELLTEEEVKKLIEAAEHPRDKAFVSCLYESGARIGEIASLQIKNVNFDEHGAVLDVLGKTGPRPIRIISSVPYLATWMENHPLKCDRQAPLWVNIGTTRKNGDVMYGTIRMMLQRLFSKSGIKKRFNPHMFRHARATFLADHLTEFQMNQYFGWIQGSEMPSTYVHMSGKKIDSSILALNGIKSVDGHKESSMKPRICPRCDTINSADGRFCLKCGGIMDIKTAFEIEEKKETVNNVNSVMNMLMKDKEFLDVFVAKVKALGLQDKIVT